MKKIAANTIIQPMQPRRFGIDIQTYKSAIRAFENVDASRRTRLYDIYTDILLDPHLLAVIDKRKASLLSTPIQFRNADGTENDDIRIVINAPWFNSFIADVLDARFWGFSFFQFERDRDGWITYQCINRKHVDPVNHLIRINQNDEKGIAWDNFYNTLFVGSETDLGLLASAAPYVIYKRNTMGDWSQFSELFGMPIREYTYDAADEDMRQAILHDAETQGSASVFIHPTGSALNFIESAGKSASSEVYKTLTERCNSEISKLILGNTLTTEAGENGTQALGTVQQQSEVQKLFADRKFVLDVLNYEMTDLFAALGLNTSGGSFVFEETENTDMTTQLNIVQGLYNMGLEISDEYLYDKFGIPRPDNNQTVVSQKPDTGNPDTPDQLARQRQHWIDFFDKAPNQ